MQLLFSVLFVVTNTAILVSTQLFMVRFVNLAVCLLPD